ncbi:MAG: hypothetical protein M1818_007796 [Claussenomyces sp. TS43310]|nr:MAG: hypothetical protein M1818_007796 [Claussenomyces sp. TS43310]
MDFTASLFHHTDSEITSETGSDGQAESSANVDEQALQLTDDSRYTLTDAENPSNMLVREGDGVKIVTPEDSVNPPQLSTGSEIPGESHVHVPGGPVTHETVLATVGVTRHLNHTLYDNTSIEMFLTPSDLATQCIIERDSPNPENEINLPKLLELTECARSGQLEVINNVDKASEEPPNAGPAARESSFGKQLLEESVLREMLLRKSIPESSDFGKTAKTASEGSKPEREKSEGSDFENVYKAFPPYIFNQERHDEMMAEIDAAFDRRRAALAKFNPKLAAKWPFPELWDDSQQEDDEDMTEYPDWDLEAVNDPEVSWQFASDPSISVHQAGDDLVYDGTIDDDDVLNPEGLEEEEPCRYISGADSPSSALKEHLEQFLARHRQRRCRPGSENLEYPTATGHQRCHHTGKARYLDRLEEQSESEEYRDNTAISTVIHPYIVRSGPSEWPTDLKSLGVLKDRLSPTPSTNANGPAEDGCDSNSAHDEDELNMHAHRGPISRRPSAKSPLKRGDSSDVDAALRNEPESSNVERTVLRSQEPFGMEQCQSTSRKKRCSLPRPDAHEFCPDVNQPLGPLTASQQEREMYVNKTRSPRESSDQGSSDSFSPSSKNSRRGIHSRRRRVSLTGFEAAKSSRASRSSKPCSGMVKKERFFQPYNCQGQPVNTVESSDEAEEELAGDRYE